MNTVNIPGFTAEDSLYRTSGRYQMTRSTHRVELNASLVQPSAAIYVDGRFVCYGEVTGGGFINCYPPGGGPSEPPEPRCGPCIRGRQRCVIPGVGSYSAPCSDEFS
jgi:hypothetical protein